MKKVLSSASEKKYYKWSKYIIFNLVQDTKAKDFCYVAQVMICAKAKIPK